MTYIKRDIENLVTQASAEYPALLISGPRQVGKTTLLEHMTEFDHTERCHVSMDDLNSLALAQSDPHMFFQVNEPPILIDEVQEAPGLFREIKRLVDEGAPAGSFWLTGSQQFRLMELASESLAGRIAVLPLSSLSQHEIYGSSKPMPFEVRLDLLKKRVKQYGAITVKQLFGRMHEGAMPAIIAGKFSNLDLYYSSYIQTFIERDVRRIAGALDALRFHAFMKATAARCAQMLNVASIAKDIDERPDKVKQWLSVLERSGIIFYLHPYSNNQLKRTVKAPKLYFHDCGLVAHLTKWSGPETMEAGAMSGAFFENYVVSEIYKSYLGVGADVPLYYYRDHDAKEIDLILESDGELHPIEIKKSSTPTPSMVKSFSVINKSKIPRGTGAVICMSDKLSALDSDILIYPAWGI